MKCSTPRFITNRLAIFSWTVCIERHYLILDDFISSFYFAASSKTIEHPNRERMNIFSFNKMNPTTITMRNNGNEKNMNKKASIWYLILNSLDEHGKYIYFICWHLNDDWAKNEKQNEKQQQQPLPDCLLGINMNIEQTNRHRKKTKKKKQTFSVCELDKRTNTTRTNTKTVKSPTKRKLLLLIIYK